MKFPQLAQMAWENLTRNRLRAFLTIAGVVIAIAAFVAMTSFGAGNRKHVTDAYREFGLLNNMRVTPHKNDSDDSTVARVLDKAAMAQLAAIPGVVLVYPFMSFDVTARVMDSVIHTQARAVSQDVIKTQLFKKLLSDKVFSSDTAREVIVTHRFLSDLGLDNPDTLLGKQVIITVYVTSLDSAIINVARGENGEVIRRLRQVRFDSLFVPEYRARVIRREMNDGLRRFTSGLFDHQLAVSDTLTVIGVSEKLEGLHFETSPIIIPESVARRLTARGIGVGNDPVQLIEAMRGGYLFNFEEVRDSISYPRVTLELDPYAVHKTVRDSVEGLGFSAFSFAENLSEIQRFFFYFNLAMMSIGMIALATASMGIANTMVMSIIERRREIGIIKALGADEWEIKVLFLMESAVIGAVGSAVGILAGWIGTRVAAAIMQEVMRREEIPVFDPFALPLWLVLLSLGFGIVVAVIAGYYPASRAARVDPIEALRSE